jgi:hypothetical protein
MTMTAAVAAGITEDPLQGRRRAPRLDGDRVNGRRLRDDRIRELPVDETRARGLPYLARVPECEPPFDDEIGDPSGIRPFPRRAVPSQPVPRPAARAAVRSAAVPPVGPTLTLEQNLGTSRPTTKARVTAPTGAGADCVPGTDWRTAGDVGPVPPSERVARTTPASVAALGVTGRTAGTSALVHSAGVPTWSDEADIGVRLTTTADLPSAERSASVLARAVIEVLSGRRPLGQLRVHCAPDVYAGLANRPTFASASLPHLVSVRVCEPADGVAEVSVAFRRAERVRALAFRIQGVDGRWRMTALQLC